MSRRDASTATCALPICIAVPCAATMANGSKPIGDRWFENRRDTQATVGPVEAVNIKPHFLLYYFISDRVRI